MMSKPMFCWYELRTKDTVAAQAFYADVVGFQVRGSQGASVLSIADQPAAGLSPLPERAAARGAPAHWLGHIGVPDVDSAARRIVAAGGEHLGPVKRDAEGITLAVLRDPFGSVLALSSTMGPASPAVAWHELHTQDRDRALSLYGELFGWRATKTLDLGLEAGPYQMFAWDEGGQSVGGTLNSARLPNIHPHWLFYFNVDDLDGAVAKVRARGGLVINDPMQGPGGARIAQGEDPQGAEFALYERASRTSR